jgi:hypothetical protein
VRDNVNCRCSCPRCTVRSLRGPAVLITVGILFLLEQIRGDYFSFHNTWPVILVVLGLISLVSSLAPMDGHVAPAPTIAPGTLPPPSGPLPGPGR